MPDALAAALAVPGLGWLAAAVFVAGLVRGFAGFGTAMVYLPVAGQFLSPFEALTTLVVMDMIGPLPNMPRALRDGHPRDLLRLMAGLVLALPLGVFVLSLVAPEVFRYGVSLAALILLALLVGGWRWRGALKGWMITLTGGLGGFLAGAVGLPGPPVIMLYMAAPHPARVIRANITVYLLLADAVMIAVLRAFGHLVVGALVLGAVLALPYLAGNVAGALLFRPEAERSYRIVAYAIIAASALSGLPLWG